MGAAWGDDCAKCPQKGTQAYKLMCGSGKPGMMVDPVTGVTHEIDECQMTGYTIGKYIFSRTPGNWGHP